MRVFVTGASGWIGSATVPELTGAGHQVLGLARSESSAAALAAAGAEVLRGDLDDLDTLRAGAAGCDGVIHLAFIHDFTDFEASVSADRRAIETMGAALEGSGRPLVIASGTPAHLFRLAVEQAPAGSRLHAVGDEGVPTRDIAEVIGRHLNLPVASVPAEDFGFLGRILAVDQPASAELTRVLLGWRPVQPGLIEDLDKGHYFAAAS
jgi:nucleoside-diphosphate-sugar epimerase